MPTTVGELPKIYKDTGGDRQVIESGGEIRINSGGKITAAGTQASLTTDVLTDNSGGTASQTIAAISDTATKNAVASLTKAINDIITALQGAGISA